MTDHLGDVRELFTDADKNGVPELLQDNQYYPFGMQIGNLCYEASGGDNKYKFNGKELQDDFGLNWYDYGARYYDPILGRWFTSDPLATKFTSESNYIYAGDNPIYFVDKVDIPRKEDHLFRAKLGH